MMRRRRFLISFLSTGVFSSACGCGTLLHPERVRSHHSRDLDWRVVALNGLGLILFFIPGVVAFVVDFYTGAIYLPPETATSYRPPIDGVGRSTGNRTLTSDATLQKLTVPPDQLSRSGIEHAVGERIGRTVSLDQPGSRVSPLQQLDDYRDEVRLHHQDRQHGLAVVEFFRELDHRG
jgi:hypothetical protein